MKKFNLAIATLLVAGAGLTVSSCGKYEDGPGFSLLTKKARLTGDWDAKEYVDSDGTTVADNSTDIATFDKDGSYHFTSGSISFNGTWDFSSDKEKLEVTYTSGSTSYTESQTILRLTNKELWLKDSDGDITKSEKK
jgi:hypothetical protein